ncbi:MAG: hypothetical protein ACXVRE_07020 [Gaiellaceae bacterium]
MRQVAGALILLALAVTLAGCSDGGGRAGAGVKSKPACPAVKGWQQLADSVRAPVYCPRWMPDPLNGVIKGQWNNIYSVSPDRSYLVGFIWFEHGSGELHVNLRGYPGRTKIPTCPASVGKGTLPCFADPHGNVRAKGIDATVYTVNQGADQWHVLLAWHRNGSLYTLSQHVAAPLTYEQVVADLKRMLRDLVVVAPKA